MLQVVMTIVPLLVGLQVASDSPKENLQAASGAKVSVLVEAEDGTPIPSADVKVLKWTGTWDSIGAAGTADEKGRIEFSNLPVDEYLSVVAHAKGLAATMQDVSLARNEHREITIRLSPPSRGWIKILSSDGKPVEGAEIQRLDFTDASGSKVVLTTSTIDAVGQKLEKSDANGRLNLPELPGNCNLTVWVVHPKWRVAIAENLHASSGLLTSLKLQPGVSVQVKLLADAQLLEELEGKMAEILFLPRTGGSSHPEAVRHSFPIRDGAVDFTAYPTEYSDLQLTLDNFFVTPQLINHARWPNPQLNLQDLTEQTVELTLQPKIKARGRVVDASAKPVAGAIVAGRIENLLVDWKETGVRTVEKQEWRGAGHATTDANGEYEIEVAMGKAGVEIIHDGFFSNPGFVEMEIDGNPLNQFPDVVLHAVPTLSGTVLSADGQPVQNAIVRMRSIGYGGVDPVGQTDEQGKFHLEMSSVPFRPDGDGLQTDVAVVAIDPGTMTGGLASVDLMAESSTSSITIQLGTQDPDWILNPLGQKTESGKESEEEAMRKLRHELAERFTAGRIGSPVPDLHEGTWLNSSARSLEHFRGQFVLLDFWFIGCGPCHRDMPTVKMAHAAFKDMGFSVVSIHINSQTPDNVQQFAQANGMDYPIVVDNTAGDIMKQFGKLGIAGYPSYILVDPDGKIMINDSVPVESAPSLRRNKIEAIFHALQTRR